MTSEGRTMKMRKQRLMGFGLVLIAVLVIVMTGTGGPLWKIRTRLSPC